MASERVAAAWESFRDSIQEQQWFQELRGKWDELDAQQRTYITLGASAAAVIGILVLVLSFIFTVRGVRREYLDKSEILTNIQSASEELRRLRETSGEPPAADESAPNWNAVIETAANQAGVDKAAMKTSTEKPGGESDLAKENLFDIQLKHVNIKQVVRFAYYLENGSRPAKLRNLAVEATDPEGYVDATLAISTFSLKPTGK